VAMQSVQRRVPQDKPEFDVSTALINVGVNFAKRNVLTMTLWLVGLILLNFATGIKVTEEQAADYNKIMSSVDQDGQDKAERIMFQRQQEYYQSKGFFSCDSLCQGKKEKLNAATMKVNQLKAAHASIEREAKSKVGIFSEYGVEETRQLFWGMFSKGKEFGKRQSMWDMLFMGIGAMGRDESIVEFAIRFVINFLFNFTIGLCGALIGFFWYLWGVIQSYDPNFFTAASFFFLAAVCGASMVATYLFALYGAAAGSAFVIGKAAINHARLEQERRSRPRNIRQDGQYYSRRAHAE